MLIFYTAIYALINFDIFIFDILTGIKYVVVRYIFVILYYLFSFSQTYTFLQMQIQTGKNHDSLIEINEYIIIQYVLFNAYGSGLMSL